MKIAIVRLSSLGDIIFCMAALQFIKHSYPDSKITWFADSKFADILDNNPDLDNIVKIDLKMLKKDFSFKSLNSEYHKITEHGKFDIAIDLHGMIKSAVISRLAGKDTFGFHHRTAKEPLSRIFYNKTVDVPLKINTVYRYASLAANALKFSILEEEIINKKPYLYFKEADKLHTIDYFENQKKNVIFVIGSTWESRNYPKEKFVTIANSLKENILICFGNDKEREVAQYIADKSPFVRLLPKMNINQLKAAISQADLVIGGDTGPSHIAWANNIPCIVLFGPTPAHRIYPGKYCRILKSSSVPDDRKLNQNDFSIREIQESLVIKHAEELLSL